MNVHDSLNFLGSIESFGCAQLEILQEFIIWSDLILRFLLVRFLVTVRLAGTQYINFSGTVGFLWEWKQIMDTFKFKSPRAT